MWIEIYANTRTMAIVQEPANEYGGPTYERMREIAGSPFTMIRLYQYLDGRSLDGWTHDEGLLLDLRQSVILPGLYPDNTGVRGNLLICAGDIEGNSVGLTKEELEAFSLVRPNTPISTFSLLDDDLKAGEPIWESMEPSMWMPTLHFKPPRR